MIRPALASVIAGTLCITASPALSLPDLVSNWTAPGWTWPALPRAAPDGAPTNMPLGSGALPGNSWSTYWNATVRNQSGENTGGPFSHFMFLDDYFQASNWSSFLLPNGYAFYMNHPAATPIKGGRHTMLSRADIYNEIFESNESNNDWARQYIWSGLTLSPNAPATRTYDPNVFSTGVGPYWNNEGFEAFAGTHYWNVFAVIPEDASSDFDIHLSTEAPANVPQQGFGFPVASSSHVGWDTDFVILDRNVVPNGTYYAFVQNFNGTANKVVEFDADQGTLFNPGESALFYLDSGEIVEMHEVYLQGGQPTRIQIRRVAGDSDVYVGLFNPASGFAGSLDAVAAASTIGLGPNNDLFINYTAPVGDYYGIVVAKPEPQSLAKTLHYSVVVSQLPNITRYAPGGWSGAVVPRSTGDSNASFAPLSPTLPGNVLGTYANFSSINQGPVTAPNFWTRLWTDDVASFDGYFVGTLPPGAYLYWVNNQYTVPGGLHHLRSQSDVFANVTEFVETDNDFTDWFVWTPLDLANQVPVLRNAPPVRTPLGGGPYESCDGFRSPGYQGSYWTAIGMIPTSMSNDYDVRLHTASVGSKDGFGSSLAWSADPFAGNPDFCIVNFNMVPGLPFDASVTNWSGSADGFYVQRADAPYYGIVPAGLSRFGPMTLDAHDCLDIHEFYLQAGIPYYISVNNVSGNVDLEMFLFDGYVPYHTKGSYITYTNAAGSGGDEHLAPVTVAFSGYYAVVVAKSKAFDVNNASTYEVVFSTNQSAVDAPTIETLPGVFALSAPRPNPFAGQATIELAVPADGGKASVAVYDLQGRRIAALAHETTPGRHTMTWDGRDESGRSVAAGVYFVRLEAPGVKETKKITLLR